MIGRLAGTVVAVSPPHLIVDVHGVGYEVEVPRSFAEVALGGALIELWVRTVVRADAFVLYGFGALSERELFDMLVKVSGVGPSLALNVVSTLGVERCFSAVMMEDFTTLRSVPGVGEKTAKRIVIDLTSVVRQRGTIGGVAGTGTSDELRGALLALGFRTVEVEPLLARCDVSLSVEDALRWSLGELRR
ncbi:MAG: Holliday junction branch migration protein RuvA [Ferrimicrobium sp.]